MNTATETFLIKDIIASFNSSAIVEGNDTRNNAIQKLERIGLPSAKSEEYKFTPITKILEKKLNWTSTTQTSSLSSIDSFLIKDLEAYLVVLVNGKYSEELSKIGDLKNNLIITSFSEANALAKATIKSHLETVVKSEDAFALINNAFWQEGIFIRSNF